MTRSVIWTRDNCVFCTRAKALLSNRSISFEERIIDVYGRDDRVLTENQKWVTREELLQAYPDAKTVPQIWLDGQHIGGYTDLVQKLG